MADDAEEEEEGEGVEAVTKPHLSLLDFAVKSRAPCPLRAGDWISYDHQVYTSRKIVSRIKEITSSAVDCEYPVKLVNSDILDRTHEVRYGTWHLIYGTAQMIRGLVRYFHHFLFLPSTTC